MGVESLSILEKYRLKRVYMYYKYKAYGTYPKEEFWIKQTIDGHLYCIENHVKVNCNFETVDEYFKYVDLLRCDNCKCDKRYKDHCNRMMYIK